MNTQENHEEHLECLEERLSTELGINDDRKRWIIMGYLREAYGDRVLDDNSKPEDGERTHLWVTTYTNAFAELVKGFPRQATELARTAAEAAVKHFDEFLSGKKEPDGNED